MELIYTDSDRVEVGFLKDYTLDFEANTDVSKNTFEIKCALDSYPMSIGCIFYEVGSEVGGIVDSIKIDTEQQLAYLSGRTWRGFLGSKILEPSAGQDYYSVSGDANTILGQIITKINLGDLYAASTTSAGITISYQFERYIDAYTGIIKMLSNNNAKLSLEMKNGKVVLSAKPITDYSSQAELTSDQFDFVLEKKKATCNHMIGLGAGELSERLVVHRYLQANGTIGSTQYYTGLSEITQVYENTSSDTEEKLIENVDKKLAECTIEDSLDVISYDIQADLGDKFQAVDFTTGLSATQYVVSKITNINNETVQNKYDVGDIIL